MWPIIKKELRENARYLLGAFGIILFSLDFAAFACGWTFLGVRLVLNGQPTSWRSHRTAPWISTIASM